MNYNSNQKHSKEIKIIENIINSDSSHISIYQNNKLLSEGQIFRKGRKNCISTPIYLKEMEEVEIKNQFNQLLSTTLQKYQTNTQIKENKGSCLYTYLFKELWTKKITDDDISIYKCFIPIKIEHLHTFHFELETKEHNFNCIQVNIETLKFYIEQVKSSEIGLYVITACQPMSFDIFNEYCYAIRQALGFIQGCMPGGNLYYFNTELDFYYTNATRPTMKSFYYPIHTNPYHLIQFKGTSAENYEGRLTVLPIKNFSLLIRKIKENNLLSSLIVMMLEGESLQSLLVKSSIYSVALEGLTKIITAPPSEVKKPIKNKVLFTKIVSGINDVIDFYGAYYESEDDLTKLKRRVNELNKPINLSHLSNNEKLIHPFDVLGLKLSDEDIEIIKHRNDFLHGNIHLESDDRTTTTDINDYLLYATTKLYTLVSSLILKYIGYSGYIINHAKPSEKYCGINSRDDYYKMI